jgi:hypothetical protein
MKQCDQATLLSFLFHFLQKYMRKVMKRIGAGKGLGISILVLIVAQNFTNGQKCLHTPVYGMFIR